MTEMGANRDCRQKFDVFYIYLSGHITPLLYIHSLEGTASTAEVLQIM